MTEAKFKAGIDVQNKNIINVADPSAPTHAANKQYVDNAGANLDWKENVRFSPTANVTIASALVNGAQFDNVTAATGDRVLLQNQTTASQNGIYIVAASGAASRAPDADTSAEISNMVVRVAEGTVNGDKAFQLITDNVNLGTTALVYTPFGVGITYTADGQGIELSGTTFGVELDGTTLAKSASGLRVGSGAAGAGLTEASGVLAVGQGTGISVAADAVAVDVSVVVRKFAANAVVTTNPQTFTHGLGTDDITVAVWEGNEQVYPGVTKGSGTVIIDWGGAPTAGQYRVVVHG